MIQQFKQDFAAVRSGEASRTTRQKVVAITGGAIAALALLLGHWQTLPGVWVPLSGQSSDRPTSDRPVASAPTQGGRRSLMTNQGYIGAWSEEDLDAVVRATNASDTDAVASLMASDRAFWIPANRTVEVEGSSGFFGSRVKARFVGDTQYFWTVSEAIH